MFTRKIIAISAGAVLAAGAAVGAVSASAAPSAACAVTTGHVGVSTPITVTTGGTSGTFTSTSITCVSNDPNINGTWNGIGAAFADSTVLPVAAQNCATEQGTGSFNAGSAPTTSTYGTITGGTFTYERVGTHVHVSGHIVASGGPAGGLPFTAELEFIPDGTQNCVTGINTASLQGVAEVG